MADETDDIDAFGQDVSCTIVRWAVHDLDLAFIDHGSDKMEANIDVLQLGGDDILAGNFDAGLVVFQTGDGCAVAHSKLMQHLQ